MASEQTFYRASSPGRHFAPLAGRKEVDVIIVGAGFAGLATALGLQERGNRSIAILEAEQIGFGASGRNGGFVSAGFSLDNAALISQIGRPQARALYQLTVAAVELIRQRIKRYDIACEDNHAGVLLANWFDDDRELHRIREFMLREFDVDLTPVSREQCRDWLRSDRYFGALHEHNAFHFQPLKYAQGLAATLAQSGVAVHEQSRVLTIESRGGGHVLTTAAGELHCREVVICCGGYLDNLYPKLAQAVLPIATYVMTTEPLGSRLHEAMRTQAAVYDSRFAFDYYRPLADSRMLWGGRISIRERSPDAVAKRLYRDLLKVYPQLAGIKIDHAWSGLMSYASHKMPQLGQLPNGIWYAMGFGGHGIGPTTVAGEVIAKAIHDKTSLPTGFSHYGLAPTFGSLGLLAAQLTYWYFELRDWWRQ